MRPCGQNEGFVVKTLGWLAAATALASVLVGISPFLVAVFGNDAGFVNAGWVYLFFTVPAAGVGCAIAALLAIIACGLAIARGAKKAGIIGIAGIILTPMIAITGAVLSSRLGERGGMMLPVGLALALLVFVAALVATIRAGVVARPRP